MNKTMSVAEAQAAVTTALGVVVQTETTAANCEPESAIECLQAVAVAQAKLRKAERQLAEEKTRTAATEEKTRAAAVEAAREPASHSHFVKQITPLVNKMLSLRKQLASVLADVEKVLVDQNRAADVAGVPRLNAGHARAAALVAITRDGVSADLSWLSVGNLNQLSYTVAELYGTNPHRRPDNMSDAQIVDLLLRGEDLGKICDAADAEVAKGAAQYKAAQRKEFDTQQADNKARAGRWHLPESWWGGDE